jgi:transposase
MPRPRRYPPELLDRGARLVFETGRPIAHVARDLGVPSETLRKYVREVEADEGLRPDLSSGEEREEIKALRRVVYELRRANEILKAAIAAPAPGSRSPVGGFNTAEPFPDSLHPMQ